MIDVDSAEIAAAVEAELGLSVKVPEWDRRNLDASLAELQAYALRLHCQRVYEEPTPSQLRRLKSLARKAAEAAARVGDLDSFQAKFPPLSLELLT